MKHLYYCQSKPINKPLFCQLYDYRTVVVLCLILLFNSFVNTAQTFNQVPDNREYEALKDLNDDTKGSTKWTNKTGWLTGTTSADFASWRGKTVINGDVASIDLPENGLAGTLPASISNLEKLLYIILWGNELAGAIPGTLNDNLYLRSLSRNDQQLRC